MDTIQGCGPFISIPGGMSQFIYKNNKAEIERMREIIPNTRAVFDSTVKRRFVPEDGSEFIGFFSTTIIMSFVFSVFLPIRRGGRRYG